MKININNKRFKKNETSKELNKILRAYFFVLIVLMCIFSIFAGMTEAKNNTRKLSFGENVEIIKLEDII